MALESKHQVKRRIAKTSFMAILFTLVSLMFLVYFGDETMAQKITAASGIFMAILMFLTSIVLAYMGITHHSDIKRHDND